MPDITVVTDDWVSVNTLSTIAVGTRLKIQNQTTKYNYLLESVTKPDITYFGGEFITDLYSEEPSKIVIEGGAEVWVRNVKEGEGKIKLFVQEWAV